MNVNTNSLIEKRRDAKKTIFNVTLLIISVAVFAIGVIVFDSPETSAIYYLASTVGIVGGFVAILMVIFGSASLFYLPTESVVRQKTLSFEVDQSEQLTEALRSFNFQDIPNPTKNQHSGIKMEILVATDKQFAQCTVLKYVPYNYEPMGDPYLVPQSQISNLCQVVSIK